MKLLGELYEMRDARPGRRGEGARGKGRTRKGEGGKEGSEDGNARKDQNPNKTPERLEQRGSP